MIFDRIQIQNFLSIKSINLDLKDRGLVLLNGKNLDNPSLNNNGAGKSSILEAIIYALFGRTIRGLKGDAVVNNIANKNTKVFLDIIDDDGTPYRLARYRKHHIHKNSVFLYRNGKDITPKSESDFDLYITNLLQADYLTFTSSLLYSAESFKFTTATDAEIKKTFDTMLNLETLSTCRDVTRQILSTVNNKLDQSEKVKASKENDLSQFQDQIDTQTLALNRWESEQQSKIQTAMESHKSLQDKASILQSELETLQSDAETLQSDIDDLNSLLTQKQEQLKHLDELKEKLLNVKSDIKEVELNLKGCSFAIKNAEDDVARLNDSIDQENQKISKLQLKIDNLHSQLGQPCPTCGKPLDEDSISSASQEYSDQILEHSSTITSLQSQITQKQNHITKLTHQMDEHNVKNELLNSTFDELSSQISNSSALISSRDKLQKRLQSATKFFHQMELDISNKKSEITLNLTRMSQLDDQIAQIRSQSNPYVSIIQSLTDKLSAIQSDIALLSSSITSLSKKRDQLEFWLNAFSNSGIKSFILDDITPFLNRRVNKYLSKLSSNQIEVIFSTRSTLKSGESRERFSIDVLNHNGGSLYSSNSGGERKRIDLSINLALQDLVASRSTKRINLSIFDEVFDSLDENGIDSTISLLNDLSATKSTILVVSHNEYLKSYFTNVLTVTKSHGFSSIEEEVRIE